MPVHGLTVNSGATNDLIKRCTNGEHIENGELIVRKSGATGWGRIRG